MLRKLHVVLGVLTPGAVLCGSLVLKTCAMIIICPNCDTRYEVAAKAIGSAGRKVQCASCQQSWQAFPEPEQEKPKPKPKLVASKDDTPKKDDDQMFDAADEASLDAAFDAEAQKVADENAPSDEKDTDEPESAEDDEGVADDDGLDTGLGKTSLSSLRQQMRKRQEALARKLPLGRIRTQLRYFGAGLLIAVLAFGIQFRTEIVRQVPDLAGLYSLVGLEVNVTGITFKEVSTLRSLNTGVEVTLVSGRVQNISGHNARVPPIVVSILDEAGVVLYSWSVAPAVSAIGPGEVLDFETQLSNAPDGAQKVRLSLQSGRGN